jgi:hypothetical protein
LRPELNYKGKPNDKFTLAQVIAALEASAGIFTGAAQKLRCDWTTVDYYVKRYPEVKAALDQIMEERLDLAEGKIIELMNSGNVSSLIFYLRCKGKHRGYSERTEVTGADGGPVMVSSVDWTTMTPEERAQIYAILARNPPVDK